MTSVRVKCINSNCERMILHETAERNKGRCAVCERELEHSIFEHQKATLKELYTNSPPKSKKDIERICQKHETNGNWFEMFLFSLLPKLINYNNFSTTDFNNAVKTIVETNREDLSEIAGDFLYLCEPLLFRYDNLHKGLKQIPRPYRELIASFQFWGIMSGDGISSYIEQVTKSFDSEACKGFELLDLHDTSKVVKESRSLWNKKECEFGEGVEDALEGRVYKESEDFEEQLAKFLINLTKNL